MGNYANDCPYKEEAAADKTGPDQKALVALVIEGGSEDYSEYYEFAFHQSQKCVNPKLIMIDDQSTPDMFCNPALLTHIRDIGKASVYNVIQGHIMYRRLEY
jgi:hypothetical protein